MKETRFIAQNKEKWLESETLLDDTVKDPEKLSNLFIQVVDDLSYSRTYYPNRSVRVYLNKIAREYFSIIYSHKRGKKNQFKLFWLDELPQIVIHCKKQLLISLLVFVLSAAVGMFSAARDPQFTASILGDSYVAMTKENIKNGDPMAVYKKGHQVDMFLGITVNNLMVAFKTYVFGIFLSIGTLAIMLYNGIMVGCFQFFFIEKGLFAESALTIWLHGTLEISSIILAGGAGLTLGSGLVFPGTYSRLQAFQISAMRSLKLMLGISPIIILAGIIESFLTRYTNMPDVIRLGLIIISGVFIIGYFVVYPYLKSRTGFLFPLKETRLQPSVDEPVNFERVKTNAEIIRDAFQFYKQNLNKLLPWIATVTLLTTVASFSTLGVITEVHYDFWKFIGNALFYSLITPTPLSILINTLGTSLILYQVLILIDSGAKNVVPRYFAVKSFMQATVVAALIYTCFYIGSLALLLICLSFIILFVIAFTQLTEKSHLGNGIATTVSLVRSNFGQVMGLQGILFLIMFSFLLTLTAPLAYLYISILQWNFAKTDTWASGVVNFTEIYMKTLVFNLILPIFAASACYLYFSLKEIWSAAYLKASIAKINTNFSKKQ